jgi:hypothetical protein
VGTKFYLRALTPTLTPPSGSVYQLLADRTGLSNTSLTTTTTVGGTSIDVTNNTTSNSEVYWFTEPITTAVTISGTMTVRLRGNQSAATVNAGWGVIIERTDNSGSVISTILNDTVPNPAAEIPTVTQQVSDTYTPTSTTFDVGDRIKLTVQVRNVGTMDAGVVTLTQNAAADGNTSNIEFAEDIVTDQPVEVGGYEIYGSNGYRRQ